MGSRKTPVKSRKVNEFFSGLAGYDQGYWLGGLSSAFRRETGPGSLNTKPAGGKWD